MVLYHYTDVFFVVWVSVVEAPHLRTRGRHHAIRSEDVSGSCFYMRQTQNELVTITDHKHNPETRGMHWTEDLEAHKTIIRVRQELCEKEMYYDVDMC